jgi:hypothetical protein
MSRGDYKGILLRQPVVGVIDTRCSTFCFSGFRKYRRHSAQVPGTAPSLSRSHAVNLIARSPATWAGTICLFSIAVLAAPSSLIPLTKPWLDVRSSERMAPKVDADTREKMIVELRKAIEVPALELQYGRTRIDILLIDLGDQPTATRYIATAFGPEPTSSAASVLFRAKQPSLLTSLGPFLLMDERVDIGKANERMTVPRSVTAANLCLNLVQQCSEFDESAKQWARSLQAAAKSPQQLREMVRTFWQDNAEHFITKNYQAVRPPSGVAPVPQDKATTNAAVADHVVPAAARPPAKRAKSTAVTNLTAAPQAASAMAPTAAPVPAANTAPFWPWLLLAGASLGGWLWWRAR